MGGDPEIPVSGYTGKFRLYRASEWAKPPGMRWRVENLIVLNGTTVLFGPPKTKKSANGMGFGCSAATGKSWCGFKTQKGKVLYVATEGFFGLLARKAAWEKLHGCKVDDENLRFLRMPINFFSSDEVAEALKAFKAQNFEPEFVIIDTLARSMAGGKESSTEDMSRVFELLEAFRMSLGDATSILLIAHATKDALTYRGSSVIHANADGLIESESKTNSLEITLTSKGYKDAADFETFKVRCEVVLIETEVGVQGVFAVKDRVSPLEILNEPANETERHARQLVRIMVAHFPNEKVRWTDFMKKSGMVKTTFNDALKCATEVKGWLVGGDGKPYHLNPDNSWAAALEVQPEAPSGAGELVPEMVRGLVRGSDPLRGSGPGEPNQTSPDEPNPNQVRTSGPTESCKIPDTTQPEKKPNEINGAPQSPYDREIEAMMRAQQFREKAQAVEAAQRAPETPAANAGVELARRVEEAIKASREAMKKAGPSFGKS